MGNELMELPAGVDHRLKDTFADHIAQEMKDYKRTKPPTKITAWWRVTKVHADGIVTVELVQVQLVYPGEGWFGGSFTSTTHFPQPRPSTDIGTQVRP